MTYSSFIPLAVNEDDLTTPTATKNATYALGGVYQFIDAATPNVVKQFMYVKAHTTLTVYQPYVIQPVNTSGAEWVSAAPATLAGQVTVGIPQVAFTSGYFGFVQIWGVCTAKLANETHVAGDYLELLNAGTTLIVDGTSGSTTYSPKSVAIQIGALSGAGTTTVNLFGGVRTSLISAS